MLNDLAHDTHSFWLEKDGLKAASRPAVRREDPHPAKRAPDLTIFFDDSVASTDVAC